MRKFVVLALALVMVTGLSVAVLYAEGQGMEAKPVKSQTKTGVVSKVDGQKVTLKLEARPLTFTVTDDTKIVQGDEAKTLADIKVGAKVTVEYTRGEGETRIATKITILAAEPKE